MANKPKTIQEFLVNHLWQILVLTVMGIITFQTVHADVKANTKDIKTNGNEIEKIDEKLATYPSEKWFELKFETMDKRFEALEKKIDGELK